MGERHGWGSDRNEEDRWLARARRDDRTGDYEGGLHPGPQRTGDFDDRWRLDVMAHPAGRDGDRWPRADFRGPSGTPADGWGSRGTPRASMSLRTEDRGSFGFERPSYGHPTDDPRQEARSDRDVERPSGRYGSSSPAVGWPALSGLGLDGHVPGLHSGKGPKGYTRNYERVREAVNEALARHPEIDASDIEVKLDEGEVTLTGTVSDRSQKRLADQIAEQVHGVHDVHNQLRIVKPSGTTGSWSY